MKDLYNSRKLLREILDNQSKGEDLLEIKKKLNKGLKVKLDSILADISSEFTGKLNGHVVLENKIEAKYLIMLGHINLVQKGMDKIFDAVKETLTTMIDYFTESIEKLHKQP